MSAFTGRAYSEADAYAAAEATAKAAGLTVFYPGNTAAAGAKDNHLYALWLQVIVETPPAPPVTPPGPGPDPTPDPADPETPPVGGGDETDVPEMPTAAILEEEEEEDEEEVAGMADANAPAVLGQMRRTDTDSTVFGARRGKTGETRTASADVMAFLFGGLGLAALLKGARKDKEEK